MSLTVPLLLIVVGAAIVAPVGTVMGSRLLVRALRRGREQ